MKAIIPAAGFGTRMLPAAKAVPKEMLPVLGKPTIQYVVEEAADAGASDVLLVTSRDKRAIEDHFDRSPELEDRLAEKGRLGWIQSVLDLRARVRVHSTRQMEQLGLGHAVLQARDHVGAEPFLCLLGDTIFSSASGVLPAAELVRAYAGLPDGSILVGLERVPRERASSYGIAAGREVDPGLFHVDRFVEKPRAADAPSDLAIAARYVLTPEIFELISSAAPGALGEIQLTDALNAMAGRGRAYGLVLSSERHDIGSPEGWLATNLKFARGDAGMWTALLPTLEKLMSR